MIRQLNLGLTLAAVYLCGQCTSIGFNHVQSPDGYPSQYDDRLQEVLKPEEHLFKPLDVAPPSNGSNLVKPTKEPDKWIATCDNDPKDGDCWKVIDGDDETSWTSKSSDAKPFQHDIIINLRKPKNVNGVRMNPGVDARVGGGAIAEHKVFLSLKTGTWGPPVALGTWFEDETAKWAIFEPQKAQYVRIVATSSSKNKPFITIADMDIWAVDSIPSSAGKGRWGPTINFPLVPVGVFIVPWNGSVVSFSANTHDGSSRDQVTGTTWTSLWDRESNQMSQRRVKGHDMFCPGMAFDVNGSMIITGGQSAPMTTAFGNGREAWSPLAPMKIQRGYQGSTTRADGSIFVIGGSWSPAKSYHQRFGEIYDPYNNEWRKLDKCDSETIETQGDPYPQYRADNHVWLLGWKHNSIFHAGPSAKMHWIATYGNGEIKPAGDRGTHAAMCGIAAMYDAGSGKVLTAGGAPSYEYYRRCDDEEPDQKPGEPPCDKKTVVGKPASRDAFILTLGDVNATVKVDPAGRGMHFPRTFLNAVILPNGDTFVAGGMELGEPFNDTTAQFCPETYHPDTDKWEVMACNSISRTYHSFGLLLQDATVLVGGGGLTGGNTNHLDAQIYTPPYLLSGDPRPKINKMFPGQVHLKSILIVTTDIKVTSASLIRYSGATHTVNNDQRRIKLVPIPSKSLTSFQYGIQIPEDAGIAIPGYWMLFVMSEKGVPSLASTVLILCRECKVMKSKLP